METLASVVESFKEMGKSSQNFLDNTNFFGHRDSSRRRNPIETLKRLQREAFSDISKLRERQDKVERILSMQKHSTLNESTTRVRGEVDALGGLSLINQNPKNTVINPAVLLRIAFSTMIHSKDTLQLELVSNSNAHALSLSKILYVANVNKWVAAIVAPIGAQAKDCIPYKDTSFHQVKGFTTHSSPSSHLTNTQMGSSIGVSLSKENAYASFCQSINKETNDEHKLTSFGQIGCKFPCGIELAMMGRRRFGSKFCSSKLLVPLSFPKPYEEDDDGCIAMRVEYLVGLETKISGEVEVEPHALRRVNWAVGAFDVDEDGAWGFHVGGRVEGGRRQRLQSEAFVKLSSGKKLCVKPGVVCGIESGSKFLSLVVRSSWEF